VHGEWWANYAERRLAFRDRSDLVDRRILPRRADLTQTAINEVVDTVAHEPVIILERSSPSGSVLPATLSKALR
jgi:hypothetical protein